MSVCASVTGFMIEIHGFTDSLVPFWHMPLIIPLQWGSKTGKTEDDGRLENKSRDIEDS